MIPIDINDIDNQIYSEKITDYKNEGRNLIWSMKDGSEIKIGDMKESHIKNCINMLSNRDLTSYRRAWIDIFNSELLLRRSLKIQKLKKLIYAKTIC